jgi:predicted PurR-regulated permease PerM
VVKSIETKYSISLLTPDNLKTLTDWSVREIQIVVGATVSGLGLVIATYFILWFMLTDGKKMELSFFDWLPLRAENVEFVKKHMNDMVRGNALGIPLMGVVQGLAGFLMYWLADIPDPWLWFAITFVAGMLPVVGVSLAYIPLSLILLSQGHEGKALLIFLYGVIVVGSVDNLARMWFLKKINETHPLITLFGVIAGLKMFGFIGFIFGPILIALFIMLLQVYHKEFTEKQLSE